MVLSNKSNPFFQDFIPVSIAKFLEPLPFQKIFSPKHYKKFPTVLYFFSIPSAFTQNLGF